MIQNWRVSGKSPSKDGNKVKVKTVFTLLREKLKDKTPEWAEKISGISADTIVRLAEDIARIKPAMIIEGGGTNHWFNNEANNRSMILLLSLTGNIGKPGPGLKEKV